MALTTTRKRLVTVNLFTTTTLISNFNSLFEIAVGSNIILYYFSSRRLFYDEIDELMDKSTKLDNNIEKLGGASPIFPIYFVTGSLYSGNKFVDSIANTVGTLLALAILITAAISPDLKINIILLTTIFFISIAPPISSVVNHTYLKKLINAHIEKRRDKFDELKNKYTVTTTTSFKGKRKTIRHSVNGKRISAALARKYNKKLDDLED